MTDTSTRPETAAGPDAYRLVVDHAPKQQLTLDLVVALDPPAPLSTLAPGDRFILDGVGLEGKLVGWSTGSAQVVVRRESEGWAKTTWSLATVVRRMRA
ncbi:MAG: hypothetical protein ACKVZ0_12185 [Gemmatimonadales bacterium]